MGKIIGYHELKYTCVFFSLSNTADTFSSLIREKIASKFTYRKISPEFHKLSYKITQNLKEKAQKERDKR